MNIYLGNGYVNIRKIRDCGCPFIFLIGGRGTGKTFGSIETSVEDNLKFIFLRRTQVQMEMVRKEEYSPFSKVNRVKKWTLEVKPNGRYSSMVMQGSKELGRMMALSTIANVRGFDSDAKIIIYDEFIPELHEKRFEEYEAFCNAYETINRNRELDGEPPVIALCLSNSNTLNNPLLEGFGIVDIIQKKKKEGKTIYINRERGIAVFLLDESTISEKKRETALYKATKGTKFYDMALDNNFALDFPENIKSMDLKGYEAIAYIKDAFCVYKHKSDKTYYITAHKRGTPVEYENAAVNLKRFREKFKHVLKARMKGKVYFENYSLQIKFDNIWKLNV